MASAPCSAVVSLVSRTRCNALGVTAQSRDPAGDSTPPHGPRLCSASSKRRCAASGARDWDFGTQLLQLRHCERSEAIQKCICGKTLDCFAALAMTEDE